MIVVFVVTGSTAAQGNSPSTASVRIAHFALDAPRLQDVLDGVPVAGHKPVAAGHVSAYVELASGAHTLAFVQMGQNTSIPIIAPLDVTLAPDHSYTAAIIGSLRDGDLGVVLIDETEAFRGIDTDAVPSLIVAHNITDAPALDVIVNGVTLISGLEYGAYMALEAPPGPLDTFQVTTSGASHVVLIAVTEPYPKAFEPGTTWLFGLLGTYPGVYGEDYGYIPAPAHLGGTTIIEGGPIEIGEQVVVTMPAPGHHARYTLSIPADMLADITMNGTGEGFLDAYLRVYDAQGALVFENDEVSDTDTTNDAGLIAVWLPAGTYTIEAGTWNDAFAGTYILQIQ
ncbi:MAG: DUF4397 domain-containing protein [Anaerolineae bacterium]|nr:DUF4397 domain-containing protein [Anaerolineae bacterium]